jgi:type VI secretion system protein VasI
MLRSILFGMALTLPSLASAAEPVKCSTITDVDARLNCFDQKGKSGADRWEVTTTSNFVSITVHAAEPKAVGVGNYLDYPLLILQCQKPKTAAIVGFPPIWARDFLVGDTKFAYRFDAGETKNLPTQDAIGFWYSQSEDSIRWIKDMIASRLLTILIESTGEDPTIMQFDLSGLEEAIKPLRETCGW